MEILSQKFPGRICICEECGALLGDIQESDIYSDDIVYCLICKHGNHISYNKNYNGIIEEKQITELKE